MADDLSTSTDEAVDTSVGSEDTSNESDDVDLEDIEVDIADIESNDDPEEETEVEEADTTDEASDDDTEESEESEPSEEEQRKADAREHYERRQAEKQARIERVKQDQANYIMEASENRDPLELAVRQLQVTEYNNTVEAVSNKLTNGYERAVNDFPVLKDATPEIQAEIDATIDAFQAMECSHRRLWQPN